jgi:hypothetical protein
MRIISIRKVDRRKKSVRFSSSREQFNKTILSNLNPINRRDFDSIVEYFESTNNSPTSCGTRKLVSEFTAKRIRMSVLLVLRVNVRVTCLEFSIFRFRLYHSPSARVSCSLFSTLRVLNFDRGHFSVINGYSCSSNIRTMNAKKQVTPACVSASFH